jgi:hypothetical protein
VSGLTSGHLAASLCPRSRVPLGHRRRLRQRAPSTGTLAGMQAPLAGATPAELENGLFARAQRADVAGYSSSYLVAGALGLNV